MAVDTFIWVYAVAFGLATVISVSLLIAAARRIGKNDKPEDKSQNVDLYRE